MTPKQFQFEAEQRLAEEGALDALQVLVDAGCNRVELLSLLEWAFWTEESWKKLVDMNLREFKGAISEIRHCAGKIERLETSELIFHLGIELGNVGFEVFQDRPTLSERLREYARLLDVARVSVGPEKRIRLNAWKARIVATVDTRTGRVFDPEVSTIISALVREPNYSEKAHQAWRLRHANLIARTRAQLSERGSGRSSQRSGS